MCVFVFACVSRKYRYVPTPGGYADGSLFPSDALVQGLLSKNILSTVYFHACTWSMICTGFIYTFGGYFRKPVWTNKLLMAAVVALFTIGSIMILLPSTGKTGPILRSDVADPPVLYDYNAFDDAYALYPLPADFKVQLFFLIVGFVVTMMLAEQAVIILCQRIDGETGWTRLMQQIVGDQAHLLQEIQLS